MKDNDGVNKMLEHLFEEHFGAKSPKIRIIEQDHFNRNYVVEVSDIIEVPINTGPTKMVEDVTKIYSYRMANSNYIKELDKEKDETIAELKIKVDKLEKMLENTLKIVSEPEETLSEL